MLITDHHEGFIDWGTSQGNQDKIGSNTRPMAHLPRPDRSRLRTVI